VGRLLVFRGQHLNREIELIRLPLTIGRAPNNDLVLDDPVRGVSRQHAEIRAEGDRYVLIDCQSENGIWVSGNRQATIIFDPETIATIGPFRLKVEGAPDPETVLARTPTPSVRITGFTQTPTPTVPLEPGAARLWNAGASTGMVAANKKWIIRGAAAAAALPLIIGGTLFWRARQSEQAERRLNTWIQIATAQINAGACSDALSQNIEPGLARYPHDTALESLKRRAEDCLKPPATRK
jgi:pSer/pThr/pTyr-binding forkhead associated (FHA) protein